MDSDPASNMIAQLLAMEVNDAARALVLSIDDEGQPTPETIDLTRAAVTQILDAGDDERRLTEASAFVGVLIRLLARMAAVSSDELKRIGVEVPWR